LRDYSCEKKIPSSLLEKMKVTIERLIVKNNFLRKSRTSREHPNHHT